MWRAFWIVISCLAGIIGLTWIVQGSDFFLYKTFAPKMEQARRETFEQSKAYRQGAVQELQNMQFEYVKASPDQKAALASVTSTKPRCRQTCARS